MAFGNGRTAGERFSRDVRRARVEGLSPIALFILKAVLLLFGRLVRVEGRERLRGLPHPVIFALNHNNYSETLLVPCSLMFLCGRKISFLIHWMFKDFPLVGWLMRFIDPVWVWSKTARSRFFRMKKPPRAEFAVSAAVRRFRSGISLGIFPEGKRNHDPRTLLKSRRGLGEIALQCRAPVVPIGIDFPYRKKHGRIPVLGRMIFRIGSPLFFKEEFRTLEVLEKDPAADPHHKRRVLVNLVALINQRVMASIASLCGKAYPAGGGRGALA